MPVKRRITKQRTGDAAELKAWSDLFECGYDFFGDLEPYGFPGGDACAAAREAARDAWQRMGVAFMETWKPVPNSREQPWALDQFGPPKGVRNAG